MPWKSKKQQRWGHSPSGLKALGGKEKVHEWDSATNFGGLPEMAKKSKWMQAESEREKSAGTKGVFSAAASRAGKSTQEFAEENKHAGGKKGKRARLALAFMSARDTK